MKVACVQMRSGIEIGPNLKTAERLIREAAAEGATFIATPEMTHILQRKSADLFANIYEEQSDPGVESFSKLAKELNIHLLIGSLAIRVREDKAANRSFLFDPDGEIKARYDKIHLFDVTVSKTETWMESRVYQGGNKAVIVDVGSARIGLSICYDVRFAQLYRHYAQAGARILTVPAAFTRPTGQAHWKTLLRARAIETGAYVLAPAQGGTHADGRATWGHSLIVDPWGEIVAEFSHDEPGVLCADIDLANVDEARRRIPAWQTEPEYTV